MPYISSSDGRREALRRGESALTAGELNYQIFYTVKHYYPLDEAKNWMEGYMYIEETIKKFVTQFLGNKPNYQRYNDMTGALVRCYAEIKRRSNIEVDILLNILTSYNKEIDKYEDTKIISNGDVE